MSDIGYTSVGHYQTYTSYGTVSTATTADTSIEDSQFGILSGSTGGATFMGGLSTCTTKPLDMTAECDHCEVKLRGGGRLCRPCKDLKKKKIIEYQPESGRWVKTNRPKIETPKIQSLKFDADWDLVSSDTKTEYAQPAMFALGVEDAIVMEKEETVTTTLTYASKDGKRFRKQVYINGQLQSQTLSVGGEYGDAGTVANTNFFTSTDSLDYFTDTS